MRRMPLRRLPCLPGHVAQCALRPSRYGGRYGPGAAIRATLGPIRTFLASIDSLPDGTYVAVDQRAWLVVDDALLAWSGDRYLDRLRRPRGAQVTVLTPPSIVDVLRAGYKPGLHDSADFTFA